MGTFYKFKVILAGASGVGKTSLLHRFIHGKFAGDYLSTIGVDFLTKDLEVGEDQIKLSIWDLAGQAGFKFMRKNFYTGAKGALLVFDLTRKESFGEIGTWYNEILDVLKKPIPFLLIGNKVDIVEEKGRAIEKKDAESYAKLNKSNYIETSARTGEKVEDAFMELTRLMIKSQQ